jgi:Uma2 family endonuclease
MTMTLARVDRLAHLKAMIELAKSKDSDSEEILLINNIDWQQYENLLDFIGDDNGGILLKYGEKILTIMSPSRNHEFNKKIISILLETYCLIKQIKFYPLGSTTFRSQKVKKGIEPDESYCFDRPKEFPDLAIEVIITSGGINTLDIYQGLGVPEVWFWEKEQLKVYVLQEQEYQQVNKSTLFPDLDLDLFASYITKDEPLDAVLEFRKIIEK